jgi:hypothetical protein
MRIGQLALDGSAGVLMPDELQRWCISVTELRRRASSTKVVGFPRSAGGSLQRFTKDVPVEAVGGGCWFSPPAKVV